MQEAQGSIPRSVQIKPHPVSSGLLLSLLPIPLLIFPPAPTSLLFPKYVHLFSPESQFFLSLLRTPLSIKLWDFKMGAWWSCVKQGVRVLCIKPATLRAWLKDTKQQQHKRRRVKGGSEVQVSHSYLPVKSKDPWIPAANCLPERLTREMVPVAQCLARGTLEQYTPQSTLLHGRKVIISHTAWTTETQLNHNWEENYS